ncbi:MAG: MFS transporter [Acidobacteria bacterium]|nr:MFS transporter [Acidobacteriota bacterium]
MGETESETPRTGIGFLAAAFEAFRYRDFRLVWIGAFTSTTGTWMQTVAQSWVVLSITGSAFYLGVDAFLATLPMILFSLFGGVVADRVDRRNLLILSQVLQMTFAFVLAGLIFTESVEVWHIFVLSFLTGTAQSIGGPAYQALLPLLVERRDVPNAVALNSMQFNLARMIGPTLAGFALATVGAAACFGLNGVSFIAVIVTLLMVHTSFRPKAKKTTTILFDLREGFHFMGEHHSLIHLSLLAFATTFFGIPIVTLMPVVAKEIFGMGATGYSWLMAASGAGSVAGALFIAGSARTERKGRMALLSLIAFALFLLAFAFSRNLWLTLGLTFFTGASLLGVIALVSSLVQLATSEEMRGRVMSIFMLAFRGGMPLGNLAAGWTAERWSVTTALAVNAIAIGSIGFYFLFSRSRIREL